MESGEFQVQLARYAELLIQHGVNVQPGQLVQITAEVIHRDFVALLTEMAYRRGASFVDVTLIDGRTGRLRVLESSDEGLDYVPRYVGAKYDEMVEECAANLRILGSEDPDQLADLDPKKMNRMRLAQHKAMKNFYDEGIGKSKVHWSLAAAATPRWGQKLFPDLDGEAACAKLWEAILKVCRADRPNCLELWKEHNDALHERGRLLTELQIKELHFTGGGTDLRVGLSPRAIFAGGTDRGPRGVDFEPNIPTEEVFTTPDYRMTEGTVRATRPFLVHGKLIEGLEMEFRGGVLTEFRAESGKETFGEYISSDEGAKRLGEVALVGIDSPVYQSGLVFQEILFDENAACHIAIGSAYKFCLRDGDTLNAEQLQEIGCNESNVHTDMMISSEEVDVDATTYEGQTVKLLEGGRWVFPGS